MPDLEIWKFLFSYEHIWSQGVWINEAANSVSCPPSTISYQPTFSYPTHFLTTLASPPEKLSVKV